MIRSAISLGGNLGDVAATFDQACRTLAAHSQIVNLQISRCYQTVPMGGDAGGEFLNAAATFETTLDPEPLLDLLQQIERDQDRVRTVRWGPRTLDLDLLLYGEQTIETQRLRVPHPAMWHRRFVLDPLCEIVPEAVHPAFDLSLAELRARLLLRPLPVCFRGESLQPVAQTFLSVRADINVCATANGAAAAIVFAAENDHAHWPHVVQLPDEKSAAMQLVADVLTAALNEPIVF